MSLIRFGEFALAKRQSLSIGAGGLPRTDRQLAARVRRTTYKLSERR